MLWKKPFAVQSQDLPTGVNEFYQNHTQKRQSPDLNSRPLKYEVGVFGPFR